MNNQLDVSAAIFKDAPIKYEKQICKRVQLDFGNKLIEYLLLNKNQMFVVETKEEFRKKEGYSNIYKISCSLTATEVKTVRIPRLEDLSWAELNRSAWNEVKRRVKNRFIHIFKT